MKSSDYLLTMRAQRKALHLPKNEAELLQKIKQGVPSAVRQRYAELETKLHEETLTAPEQEELLRITDQIELADAARLQNLILLAQLQNVSVDILMDQLGLRRSARV